MTPEQKAYLYAGAAVLAAAVVANTYRLSAEVDRARAETAQCESLNRRLQSALDEQNSAIEDWKTQAAGAQQRAARALEQVEAAERSRQAVQGRLEAFRRADGESDCAAARRLLLEYRR